MQTSITGETEHPGKRVVDNFQQKFSEGKASECAQDITLHILDVTLYASDLQKHAKKLETELQNEKEKNVELNQKLCKDTFLGEHGIYHKRKFNEDVSAAIKDALGNGKPKDTSLVLFDIDNFKHYNDTHGHDAGDVILLETAKIIEKSIRENDKAYRIGGEELAILAHVSQKEAFEMAENIRKQMEGHNWHEGRVTISGGVDTYPYSAREQIELYQKGKAYFEKFFHQNPKYDNIRKTLSESAMKYQWVLDKIFSKTEKKYERFCGKIVKELETDLYREHNYTDFQATFIPKRFIKRTDEALYVSKKTGRNKTTIYRDIPTV